jgi:enoyl-CoA hydratase/carnithine racemase
VSTGTTTATLADQLTAADLRGEIDGPVARLTLTRPDRRNAQRPSMWAAMRAFGDSLGPDVRVVVVSGEGPAFSAGLDRQMFTPEGIEGEPSLLGKAAEDPDGVLTDLIGYQAGFEWLRDPAFVSIAAVQGHAIGAGFQLALACDLRVAASDAQFTMAETTYGLVPDLGGTRTLVETVGYARALEICATTRRVGAEEAERLGLVQLLVGPDQLEPAVDDLVAALLGPMPGAVRELKALLQGATAHDQAAQLAAERHAQLARFRDLLGT